MSEESTKTPITDESFCIFNTTVGKTTHGVIRLNFNNAATVRRHDRIYISYVRFTAESF